MCRIYIADMKVVRKIGVTKYADDLRKLELSQGGHGNGIWLSSIGVTIKGTGLFTDDAANIALEYGGNGVAVFHTRLASAGGMSGELNHPFSVGPRAVLVHNGTWSGYPQNMGTSDTHAVSRMILRDGIGTLFNLAYGSGVWALVWGEEGNEKILVVPKSKMYHLIAAYNDEELVLASERVAGMDAIEGGMVGIISTPQLFWREDGKWHSRSVDKVADVVLAVQLPRLFEYEEQDFSEYDGTCTTCGEDDGDMFFVADRLLDDARLYFSSEAEYQDWRSMVIERDYDACAMCKLPSEMCVECPVFERARYEYDA